MLLFTKTNRLDFLLLYPVTTTSCSSEKPKIGCFNSPLSSTPFFKTTFPSLPKNGVASSKQLLISETPLNITASANRSDEIFSALSLITLIPLSPNSKITVSRKLQRFLWLYIRVATNSGYIIFRGIPGKPAPLPISTISSLGDMTGAYCKESNI